jgi:hypothetical protein
MPGTLRAKAMTMIARFGRNIVLFTALVACSSHDAARQAVPRPAPAGPSIEIGVPGGDDGLAFIPFEADQVLKLETFGQGGTHILLAARTRGFGIRAYTAFTVENLATGATLVAPAPTRPQLYYCHEEVCDLVPVTMMMGGIAAPDADRNDLTVAVTVDAHTEAGLTATDSHEARLSTEDLGVAGAGP